MRRVAERLARQATSTAQSVAGGIEPSAVPGELSRDAARAWDVLTREHAGEPVPKNLVSRLWHWCRLFYLGVSSKLSPARRLLFVVCLVAFGLGVHSRLEVVRGVVSIPSPALILATIGLVLLLVLELADRVLVRDELEVARALQRDLLPRRGPDVPGYGFAFSTRSANTIGGDYYDFLPLEDGRLVIVIGDASGHGIAAGLLMAVANTALRLALDLNPTPAAVAAMVNRALVRVGDRRSFMSLLVAILEPASGRLEYACAGHPYPILRRRDGGIEELGRGSLPLGIRPQVEPYLGEAVLGAGDTLVLYTDGVPEELALGGEAFGFERLRRLVEDGGTASELHDRVVAELEQFRGVEPAHDDRSLVVIDRL